MHVYNIEPEEILLSIYKNGMKYEPCEQEEIRKIFNLLFLNRTCGIIKKLGYMQPKNLIPYQYNNEGIIHPDAILYWQEIEYPYILYCKYVNGWYANLHLPGTEDIRSSLHIDNDTMDRLLELHMMYYGIHDYCYDVWDAYVDHIPQSVIISRKDLYYPKDRLYSKKIRDGEPIACLSYDELDGLIRVYLPNNIRSHLNDTCFVAGGFLAKLSKGIIPTYEDGGDINIWIVRGENDGYSQLNLLLNAIEMDGYDISNDGFTFLCSKNGELPIQIIPCNYVSLMDIIDHFDTSCTAIAYNGKEIFASWNFKQYIGRNKSYCMRSVMHMDRYRKYKEMGYYIVLSGGCSLTNKSYAAYKPRDNFREICFDINLFEYNNDRIPDTFMSRKYIKIDVSPDIVNLCNKLSRGTYIDNTYISYDEYQDLINGNMFGYSTIKYYMDQHSCSIIHITEGIKNDLSARILDKIGYDIKYASLLVD